MSDIVLPWTVELNSSQYIFNVDNITMLLIALYFAGITYFSWKKWISIKEIISKILFDIAIMIFVIKNILDLSFPLSLIILPKCWCDLTLMSSLSAYLWLSILVLLKFLMASRLDWTKILLNKEIIFETLIIIVTSSFMLLLHYYF